MTLTLKADKKTIERVVEVLTKEFPEFNFDMEDVSITAEAGNSSPDHKEGD